jgi:hypothetical protein
MDLFLEALASLEVTLAAEDFEVDRSGDSCRVTLNMANVLDAVTLNVATVANNLSLTAIPHTSSDAMFGADPAEFREHRVDVTLP